MSIPLPKEIGAMSDEELSQVLSNALAPESENPDNSEVEPDEVVEEQVVEPVQESVTPDEPADAPAVNSVAEELAKLRSEMEAIRSENEKVRKDNENLQRLNGHLSNKVGVLKKELPPMPTDDDMLASPVEATQKVLLATMEKARADQEAQAEIRNHAMLSTLGVVTANVPDFAEHIEDMAAILKDAGMPAEHLNAFRHNPVAVITDAPHLVHLAERAKQSKEIASLRQQLEEAKKGPQKMAEGLKNAAAAAPAISGTTVRAGATKPSAPPNFQKMSYKELEKFLSENSSAIPEDE